MNKIIEPNTSNKIEQIASKQEEIAINQTTFHIHFKHCLDNILTLSLTIPFRINISKQNPILTADQLEDINRTRMEYLLLSAKNYRVKNITIGSERLGK